MKNIASPKASRQGWKSMCALNAGALDCIKCSDRRAWHSCSNGLQQRVGIPDHTCPPDRLTGVFSGDAYWSGCGGPSSTMAVAFPEHLHLTRNDCIKCRILAGLAQLQQWPPAKDGHTRSYMPSQQTPLGNMRGHRMNQLWAPFSRNCSTYSLTDTQAEQNHMDASVPQAAIGSGCGNAQVHDRGKYGWHSPRSTCL